MNEILIRKATIEDIEAVSTIQVRSWQSAYRKIIDKDYLNTMDIESRIEKRKKDFNQYGFIVAELNNEVVGFCRYDYCNDVKKEDNIDCELRALYVKPELKRNGIGKKLIQYVIDEFKNARKRKMILWCLKDNFPSRAFYEAMGGKTSDIKTLKFEEKEYEIISYLYELQKENR